MWYPLASDGEYTAHTLQAQQRTWADCQRCPLARNVSRRMFLATGSPDARILMLVPPPTQHGLSEVTERIRSALQTATPSRSLEDVLIVPVLACQTPRDRLPLAGEIHRCRPRIAEVAEALRPEIVVALGEAAQEALRIPAGLVGDVDRESLDLLALGRSIHGSVRRIIAVPYPAPADQLAQDLSL